MEVYLQAISGWDDAITSMYMTKGNWTPELGDRIHKECDFTFDRRGRLRHYKDFLLLSPEEKDLRDKCLNRISSLFRFGKRHITMMRFLDFSFVVTGLHRGAQDDWDAHEHRFNSRIIRLSTRIGAMKNAVNNGKDIQLSDFYKDKVMTLSEVLDYLNIDIPNEIEKDGKTFVRSINGYVDKDNESYDVKRGLYPLGLSSAFIFKCNLCEYPHVRSLRRRKTEGFPESGHAHPELWDLVDEIDRILIGEIPALTSDWLDEVKQ